MKRINVEVGDQDVPVEIFESVDEAKKALGDVGILELINNALKKATRDKAHRKGQLERNRTRREEQRAMIEFAKKHGYKPE